MSNSLMYIAAAVISGATAGWLFYRLWRHIIPHRWVASFWRSISINMQGMLTCEEPSGMLSHYRALLVAIGGYVARNILGLSVAMIPMAVCFLVLTTYDPSSELASSIEIYPAAAAAEFSQLLPASRVQDGRFLIDRAQVDKSGVTIAGNTLDKTSLAHKYTLCTSALSCLFFELMLFETRTMALDDERVDRSIVVRPAMFDNNPLWPYLNDLDFCLFLAALLGSVVAVWSYRHRDV